MSVVHEELVLGLLRGDLEECGDGVSAAALAAGSGAWRPERVVRGLRRRGCVIEELPGPRFKLWSEPASTEPSGVLEPCETHAGLPARGGAPDGSVGDGQLWFGVAA